MTNKEILEAAIQKAIDGGWKPPLIGTFKGIKTDLISGEWFTCWQYEEGGTNYGHSVMATVFNHDFAKALWGNDWPGQSPNYSPGYFEIRPRWKSRLQDMVVAEDPIAYLGEHLE